MPDRPYEPGVRHGHRPRGAGGRQVFQRRPDGSRRELTQRNYPDDADERLQDFPLGADRLRCPPGSPVGQPVLDRLRHGVASVGDYSVVQLIVQLCQLGPDLGLVLARDLLAPPLAVRTRLEADHTAPAARAMSMVLRVAALPRVIELDTVLAPAAPARHGRQRTGSLSTWLQEWLPTMTLRRPTGPLTWWAILGSNQ